jgi:hypothetical protein
MRSLLYTALGVIFFAALLIPGLSATQGLAIMVGEMIVGAIILLVVP